MAINELRKMTHDDDKKWHYKVKEIRKHGFSMEIFILFTEYNQIVVVDAHKAI